MTLALPRELAVSTGETDPIRYYTRPGIGWVFRRRIAMGLEMIPPMPANARALEVGYAAGVVLYNLAPKVSELHGLDLDADPVPGTVRWTGQGVAAHERRGAASGFEPDGDELPREPGCERPAVVGVELQ